MMAYEVVGLCEDNDRTYESVLGTYSKKTGFILSDSAYGLNRDILADRLFQLNDWHLKKEEPKRKKMTIEEIEKELGYKIEIANKSSSEKNEIKNEKSTKNKKEEYDDESIDDFAGWFLDQIFANSLGRSAD